MGILQNIKDTFKNMSCTNEKCVDVISPKPIPNSFNNNQQLQEKSPHIIQMRGVMLHHK